ncbi:MarR family winged helix-turn-helix transcriptional regulator [Nocardiopsis baichengensis]|uniref:MarR family winged helix-turn-helix transcriptional regulator n=1 Tax=Nocardiopsis baichengensis TaxID=280240 RepID=UPI00034AC1CF|nr:MarR family transcriptional regulator [Nocardiopsis baichengensis]
MSDAMDDGDSGGALGAETAGGAEVTGARADGLPPPELIDRYLRHVPLLEAWYRRAPQEMPPELAEAFQSNKLTGRHGSVLAQLVHGREPTVGELSVRLGVRLSTVSELVGDLAYAGLVTRRKDPANRRRVLVALSEEYRPLMERFAALRAAPLLRVLERLSPQEREGFAAGLKAWAEEATPP